MWSSGKAKMARLTVWRYDSRFKQVLQIFLSTKSQKSILSGQEAKCSPALSASYCNVPELTADSVFTKNVKPLLYTSYFPPGNIKPWAFATELHYTRHRMIRSRMFLKMLETIMATCTHPLMNRYSMHWTRRNSDRVFGAFPKHSGGFKHPILCTVKRFFIALINSLEPLDQGAFYSCLEAQLLCRAFTATEVHNLHTVVTLRPLRVESTQTALRTLPSPFVREEHLWSSFDLHLLQSSQSWRRPRLWPAASKC